MRIDLSGSYMEAGREAFPQGSQVRTHSLTSVQYNALSGIVTGPPVESKGITRIPVCLELQENKGKKDLLLQSKNISQIRVEASSTPELRECRCMFCGESLLLESEASAVDHMEVCPSLQEQLNDTEHQFTLPQSMK